MVKRLTFSQRAGLTPVKTILQVESADRDLRTAIWNWYHDRFLTYNFANPYFSPSHGFGPVYKAIWADYFRQPVDELNLGVHDVSSNLRGHILECQWFELYDFLEFMAELYADTYEFGAMTVELNEILESELSGYRLVGPTIAPITSPAEMDAVAQALDDSSQVAGVQAHLQDAISKLSDRKTPDFRNSIKESISAVEALCRIITKQPKATLGDALAALRTQGGIDVHPALSKAFSALYGWTSDAQGIRHSLLDTSDLQFEDAKFMLVSCSAFVGFLIAKASRANLNLS